MSAAVEKDYYKAVGSNQISDFNKMINRAQRDGYIIPEKELNLFMRSGYSYSAVMVLKPNEKEKDKFE